MMRSRPARPVAAVVLALLAVAGAACSGGGSQDPAGAVQGIVSPTVPPPARYPLTGLLVEDELRAERPALVVKIDNAPKARPQAGLEAADVVFEEVVEGGVTRFLAVFHSTDAHLLGPVRSVRPIDPAIVTPLKGLFAYSGGAPKFQALIRQAPVHDVGFDLVPDAYHRDRSRPSPSNMFTSTALLYAQADGEAPPPPLFMYLEGGEDFGGTGVLPAIGLSVVLGPRTTADWTWDGSRWLRMTNGTPHVTAAGPQLGFDNVVIAFTVYRETGDVDVSGATVPEADIVGSGEAWVLSAGELVRGRWSKSSDGEPMELVDGAGKALKLTAGRTWVSFAPVGAASNVRSPVTPASKA